MCLCSIHSCFQWYKHYKNPPRVTVENKVAPFFRTRCISTPTFSQTVFSFTFPLRQILLCLHFNQGLIYNRTTEQVTVLLLCGFVPAAQTTMMMMMMKLLSSHWVVSYTQQGTRALSDALPTCPSDSERNVQILPTSVCIAHLCIDIHTVNIKTLVTVIIT